MELDEWILLILLLETYSSSARHCENIKNNFFVLIKGLTDDLNVSFGEFKKVWLLNLPNKKKCLVFDYNGDES